MGGVVSSISDMFFGRQEQPNIPEAKMPAAPAPVRREDTGAEVVIGADAGKDGRTSKRTSTTGKSSGGSGDVLGGLGRGGLSI